MLGEMIGEGKGKITNYRVVPSRAGGVHVEVSMKDQGKILGVEFMELATYWSVMKNGFSYGEGRGVCMLRDGETVGWVGQGSGRFKQGGGMSWRGAVYFETTSKKLARLNGMCALFEHDSDADDNTSTKYWEWK
jgi:hypothetical protein